MSPIALNTILTLSIAALIIVAIHAICKKRMGHADIVTLIAAMIGIATSFSVSETESKMLFFDHKSDNYLSDKYTPPYVIKDGETVSIPIYVSATNVGKKAIDELEVRIFSNEPLVQRFTSSAKGFGHYRIIEPELNDRIQGGGIDKRTFMWRVQLQKGAWPIPNGVYPVQIVVFDPKSQIGLANLNIVINDPLMVPWDESGLVDPEIMLKKYHGDKLR